MMSLCGVGTDTVQIEALSPRTDLILSEVTVALTPRTNAGVPLVSAGSVMLKASGSAVLGHPHDGGSRWRWYIVTGTMSPN
jgi:hypothetical protein